MGSHVGTILATARASQAGWAAQSIERRLGVIGRARRALARAPDALLDTLAAKRPRADTIAAELLPLLDAALFLQRAAPALLAPRRLRRWRPLWLSGVDAEVTREPLGVVLILGPSNFPLMLPGVQVLQAIAAGNAVCVKPATGYAAPMRELRDTLEAAGLPACVFSVLEDGVSTGTEAVAAGFDKIVLTGSAGTGAKVLAVAAPMLTPATLELSGCDAVFVLPSADIGLVADCLAYGMRLNHGATCIAPRRVFVPTGMLPLLEAALLARVATLTGTELPQPVRSGLAAALDEAVAVGARVVGARDNGAPAFVIVVHPEGAPHTELSLLRDDIFAPVLSLIPITDADDAIAAARACPYALGASIFGDRDDARALIPRIRAGSVVINDMIVPTADPRLPFGGRGRSGFGVTRGAEGLLEMTALKAVSVRRGRFRPHLRPPAPGDAAMMQALLRVLHGGAKGRAAAIGALLRAGMRRR
jgi:acyl-CoA reductase-like NAD-dependent aldehyde dehydrogenase